MAAMDTRTSAIFLFLTGNSVFGPKNQNVKFKLKFGTYTNSNMQNSMALFTFSVLDMKLFLGKFGLKNQNCQFKLKFGT